MFKQNKQTKSIISLFGLLLLLTFCSCGLPYEKLIKGKYYIIGVDTKTDIGLSYKLVSGDYIGKAPGRLLQYGFNDTFLVAKTYEYNTRNSSFYILNMTKNSELAHEETFRVGPLTEKEYNKIWKERLKIQLSDVK